jgi:hypothetical protein
MTGEQLFLRYAFPCIDPCGGMIVGKKYRTLRAEHLAELRQLVATGGQPRRSLLRYCFPYAFRGLRKYAEENHLERWALATVIAFWRHCHGHIGECRVRRCAIAGINETGIMAAVTCEDERLNAINLYRLPLEIGQFAYIHLRVIAEIEETSV